VYANASRVKNSPDCKPKRFSYIVQLIYQNKASYVAERDGIEYKMQRVNKLPAEFFTDNTFLHKFALEKIDTFNRRCRKNTTRKLSAGLLTVCSVWLRRTTLLK